MLITNDLFLSVLACRYKASRKAAGEAGIPSDYERLAVDLRRTYRENTVRQTRSSCPPSDIVDRPPSLADALREKKAFIVDATAAAGRLQAQIDLLERLAGPAQRGGAVYVPVLFTPAKATRADKLLLAFQALALSPLQGRTPPFGKILHGPDHETLRVKLTALLPEARRLVDQLASIIDRTTAPALTLNRHCNVCEFRASCQALAQEKDDLSVLRGLSEKEITKQRKKGVLTVTQLSYTYRPERRERKERKTPGKHNHALQALAIRDKKVYVAAPPTIPTTDVQVYLDVEGVPERADYYLIGLVVVEGGNGTTHSFWAGNKDEERAVWDALLALLGRFSSYTLYHYGRYEQQFLERMKRRYGPEGDRRVEAALASSCNLLSAVYAHVYFPTNSNGLKDIGRFLGAAWSSENASGIQSLAWRLDWEANKDDTVKQRLVTYNLDDCWALKRVRDFLVGLSGPTTERAEGMLEVVASPDDTEREKLFRFGKQQFFFPELAEINKCAYADYQRDKVYLRTCQAVRESRRRVRRAKRKRPKVNQVVECQPPQQCPKCGRTTITCFRRLRYGKVISDLKFQRSGVKRWLVKMVSFRYQCWTCRATFFADEYRRKSSRVGHSLAAWAVYHQVGLRQSYEGVTESVNDIFGFAFGRSILNMISPWFPDYYRATYAKLKDKLRNGTLIHGDESKAPIKGHTGYVWAFTNLEEVVYIYTPTREGTILNEMLDGFTGVLVSDFYSAYDSAKCPQQKCLIHLMRDLNDDLFSNPFDEELKQLARGFTDVLRPVIETVDRYGLTQYHLHKHKRDVERYFREVLAAQYQSDVAGKYQKRIRKYGDKMFTFLDHDGIPWNNNNAENALKCFASRRRLMGASFTERGIKDYLMFLSIYQTLRHKGVSFLRFLVSREVDIDAFVDRCGR